MARMYTHIASVRARASASLVSGKVVYYVYDAAPGRDCVCWGMGRVVVVVVLGQKVTTEMGGGG